MGKLRIGVIGLGAIAASHLPQLLRRRQDVAVVAAADVSPAAQAVADKFDIPRLVSDYRQIIDDLDAILICAPTALHADMAVHALRHGQAVFCEKPLSRTLDQADAIKAALSPIAGAAPVSTGFREIARGTRPPAYAGHSTDSAAASSTPVLQVGFVRRFDEEWLAWRDAVLAGKIGRPVVWRDIAASAGPAAAWFHDEANGGGPFLDGAIHSLDFALHTFGPARWVFCHGRTMKETATAIDTGTATVGFESGDELMLAWSWGLPAGCRGTRVFEMLGPGGLISWPNDDPGDSPSRRFRIILGKETSHAVEFPRDSLTAAYDRQMDEFIDVALRRKPPRAGIVEGRAALRLALALLSSARSAKVEYL